MLDLANRRTNNRKEWKKWWHAAEWSDGRCFGGRQDECHKSVLVKSFNYLRGLVAPNTATHMVTVRVTGARVRDELFNASLDSNDNRYFIRFHASIYCYFYWCHFVFSVENHEICLICCEIGFSWKMVRFGTASLRLWWHRNQWHRSWHLVAEMRFGLWFNSMYLSFWMKPHVGWIIRNKFSNSSRRKKTRCAPYKRHKEADYRVDSVAQCTTANWTQNYSRLISICHSLRDHKATSARTA